MAGNSLYAAMTANFLIGVTKTVAGLLSGSAAMIAEAYHSFADTFNQVLLWLGVRRSKREPDAAHPFGYQKVQFFWAFVVAILIFGISGTLAFREGLEIIRHPEGHEELKIGSLIVNLIVLGIAIVLESGSTYMAFKEVNEYREKHQIENLKDALDEMQDPVLLSIFVEDWLALLGLVIAFVGTIITFLTHDPLWDGITSLIIGIMLMAGGLLLARENKRYLVGKGVHPRLYNSIMDTVSSFEGVKKVNSLKTMLLGPKDIIVALDITFAEQVEKADLPAHIDRLEDALIKKFKFMKKDKIIVEAQ